MKTKSPPKYRRMNWDDRIRIEALWNHGCSYREISRETGFAPSSIHREVTRSLRPHLGAECTKRPDHYSPEVGQQISDYYSTSRCPAIKLGNNHTYANYVSAKILQGWSPDVIVGRLRRAGKWTVSTQTLYRYISKGYIPGVTDADLWEKPIRKPKQKRLHLASRPPKGPIIDHRPQEINDRSVIGHWEQDSVIGHAKGKKQSVLTYTERKTRYELVFRAENKTADATNKALECVLSKLPKGSVKSFTVDNGSEFQDYYGMAYDKDGNKRLEVYYCHPYTSCERGSNERANRIIRRFFPKGSDFENLTSKDCEKVMQFMNNLPRKILDYATPAELFEEEFENFPAKVFEWT